MNLKDEDFWDRVERRVWDKGRANHTSYISVRDVRRAIEEVERENIAGLLAAEEHRNGFARAVARLHSFTGETP
jgi:hypothetical protein